MMELDDEEMEEETQGKGRRRKRKRDDEEADIETKRVRRSKRISQSAESRGINDGNVQNVTQSLANYFRVNRIGQINKNELLKKINEGGDEMGAEEMDEILKFLHDKNKIFYIDPMVHQL
eukprot:UN02656